MRKRILIILDTEEDNEQIKNCMKSYFLDALKDPENQLLEIVVEDVDK